MKQAKLLQQFFYHPMKPFHVRELSRITSLDTKTVMKYLNLWQEEGLVSRVYQQGRFVHYEANRLSSLYRYEKSQVMIKQLYASGLIDFLLQQLKPKVMVLFGSMQKGTYHQQSDIDIFIQAKSKKLNLTPFEQKMGHTINLFFELKPKKLSKGLLTNIYNGYVLTGTLEVVS